jgi:hypothetical protein
LGRPYFFPRVDDQGPGRRTSGKLNVPNATRRTPPSIFAPMTSHVHVPFFGSAVWILTRYAPDIVQKRRPDLPRIRQPPGIRDRHRRVGSVDRGKPDRCIRPAQRKRCVRSSSESGRASLARFVGRHNKPGSSTSIGSQVVCRVLLDWSPCKPFFPWRWRPCDSQTMEAFARSQEQRQSRRTAGLGKTPIQFSVEFMIAMFREAPCWGDLLPVFGGEHLLGGGLGRSLLGLSLLRLITLLL